MLAFMHTAKEILSVKIHNIQATKYNHSTTSSKICLSFDASALINDLLLHPIYICKGLLNSMRWQIFCMFRIR